MEKLHEMDGVAYVRYASVYRQFQDIGEFIEEVHAMERRPRRDSMQAELFR
jgi:transcriptional repressor NrdR